MTHAGFAERLLNRSALSPLSGETNGRLKMTVWVGLCLSAPLLLAGTAVAGTAVAGQTTNNTAQPPWSQTPAWVNGGASAAPSAVSGNGVQPRNTHGAPPAIAPYDRPLTTAATAAATSSAAVSSAAVQVAATSAYPVYSPAPLTSASPPPQGKGAGLPLWEVGMIGGVAYLPDYPASSKSSFHYLPLPKLIYRGEFLRAGDKGLVRGRFVHTRDLELDVSLNGSFPTKSEDNGVRAGMPDLEWLGELGPRLQWTVARAARDAKIDLELPARAVFSTDFHSDVSYQGFVIAPELAYQHENFLNSDVALKLGVTGTFASEDLQDYFYGVDSAYATTARAAYDAKAGYMGSKVQLSLYSDLTPWVSLIGMGQVNLHQGAANSDSPLFEDETTFGVGMALSITLAKSKSTAGSP